MDKPNAHQLQLLDDKAFEDAAVGRESEQGIYSGKDLKRYDAAKYEQVCEMLADGSNSIRAISRTTGVSRNTVSGIAMYQAGDIEPHKKRLKQRHRQILELSADRVVDKLRDPTADLGLRDLAILHGTIFDKHQLETGGATANINQRIEMSRSGHDRYMEIMQEMGLEPENPAAKGDPGDGSETIEADFEERRPGPDSAVDTTISCGPEGKKVDDKSKSAGENAQADDTKGDSDE